MNGPDTWSARHLKAAARHAFPVVKRLRALRAEIGMDHEAWAAYCVGLGWYGREREALEIIGRAAGLLWPVRMTCAAAALLSPSTYWGALKSRLPGFLAAALAGDPCPTFPAYGQNRTAAARVVCTGNFDRMGPKVGPFYAAIMGDPGAVVIDRHTCRQAIGTDVPSASERRAIVLAFWIVGASIGVAPAALQAGLWTARVGPDGLAPGRKARAL